MNYLMINVKLDYYYEYVVKVYSRSRRERRLSWVAAGRPVASLIIIIIAIIIMDYYYDYKY